MDAPSDRLLACVVDLLVADGYEGISIRRVATAAGVSIGAVQHHFPTKDALLAAAMERVAARFQERLRQRVAPGQPPEQVLRAVADELLSAGEGQRPDSVVWIARLARAAVHRPTAQVHQREWREVEDLLAGLLAAVRPDLGERAVRDEAAVLLALVDGLASAVAVEPERVPAERARTLVSRHLDAVVTAAGTGPLPPAGAGEPRR